MRLHSNATTTLRTREQIHRSTGSQRQIARLFHVSPTTVRRWQSRKEFQDLSSRPKSLRSSMACTHSDELLDLRRRGISLDDLFEMKMDEMPLLSRSALYRLLKRNGLGRLQRAKRAVKKPFKAYPPGYLHIDCFHMPRFGRKRSYCFVAVDRATKRTHTGWSATRNQKDGAAFLKACLEVFEFKVSIVLTDNGTEFSNKCYRGGVGKTDLVHAFDKICAEHAIQHRLTKPRTPQTNGLVERYNGIIKNATIYAKTYANAEAAASDIQQWNENNNTRRKRCLKYKSPLQVSQQWFTIKPELFYKEPIPTAA